MRRLLARESLRFVVVGGYNTLFGYAIFALAYWLWGGRVHYVWLAVATHFIAVTHSFLTQRFLVFRSSAPWRGEFFRFHLMYLAMMPLGIGLLAIFFEIFSLPMLLAQFCALLIMVLLSYLGSKYFTFRSSGHRG